LIAISCLARNKNRGLVELLLEPAIYLCKDIYVISEKTNKGRGIKADPDF
jgi:hypothetical protein